ncbi:hypothetical protein [Roseateles sp.]|uniref:hypothetical protein n=1 Tax=Roseateles sp. TaxID=1971397 RepID=UPI0025D26C96|nr:hypothetical protein [Roseateles sp.]MBV8036543.1 hypothetical protein [Roseateles sp.]
MNTPSATGGATRSTRLGLTFCAFICALGALAGCTTIGAGSGSVRSGGGPVSFNWISKDGGTTGSMTATLANGGVYSGPFVQLTSTTRIEVLEPMWHGWRRGWGDWRYWGPFPDTAFATQYSGKVVANLQGSGEQRMRCRFHLNSPQSGMSGGGQGECQLGDGSTVDAVFAKS